MFPVSSTVIEADEELSVLSVETTSVVIHVLLVAFQSL
jgi:hypothetical protein